MKTKTIALIQARMGSTRLPGKVMKLINKTPVIELLLRRLSKSKRIDEIIVATSVNQENDCLVAHVEKLGFKTFRGSEEDVLDRFYHAALKFKGDNIVRITADCPIVDPKLVDELIDAFLKSGSLDYISNSLPPTYPDGLDVEVFSFEGLEKSWHEAKRPTEREHVTQYFQNSNQFSISNLGYHSDYSKERWTLDEESDFIVISNIFNHFSPETDFKWLEVINLREKQPHLFKENQKILRNEGLMKSKLAEKKLGESFEMKLSKVYRDEIHKLIPGGAHTYSKGDDQFPSNAPAAISHGKGSYVWDIDGNKFLDCSMGLSSVSLGHAFAPVLEAVKEELDKGVNFQRPSYIEKEMAEKFLELVPQHQMIKFAKNGSTATTAAVKLARAHTGRKLVAFPEDHPFYSYDDWFIGKTLCSKGVPEEVKSLTVTFDSCNIESLKALFKKYPNQIAAVITEPVKPHCSNCSCSISSQEYLQQAISLTQEEGAVFILDEMVSGFKVDLPGAISKYNLNPDLATWGKGIANGFSFCALTGKKEIMDLGGINNEREEKVFLISSTHGGETHAIRAGIQTIKEFIKHDVINHNHKIGNELIQKAQDLINYYDLTSFIEITPCPWMVAFTFKDKEQKVCNGLRTYFLQEMISERVLFQGIFVPCLSHKKKEITVFLEAFEKALVNYKKCIKKGFDKLLEGEPTKAVFRKYN
jgi:spore coat polysaccharide biosynthesis protein SpsF